MSAFWLGVARGYILACRVAMPVVAIFGSVIGTGGRPGLGTAVFFIGAIGAAFAWATRLRWFDARRSEP